MPCAEDSDEVLEKAGLELENRLNNMTKEADEKMGIVPVQPE